MIPLVSRPRPRRVRLLLLAALLLVAAGLLTGPSGIVSIVARRILEARLTRDKRAIEADIAQQQARCDWLADPDSAAEPAARDSDKP
jgi:hypothetical protein